MIEEWRPVKGYEGLYEVSNLGQVKSLPRPHYKAEEKILTQTPGGRGRRASVHLVKRGEKKTCAYVARLVASAFLDPPANFRIKLKDKDVWNSRADNLIVREVGDWK